MGLLSVCVLSATVPFLLYLFSDYVDLSRPSDIGLNHTINIYLKPEEGVRVGVWYTVPEHRWKEAQGQNLEWYEKALGDGSPIFIYLHGNGGFGDSTGEPTEAGLSTDAVYLYDWVKARSGNSLVCVWGHSLGSGLQKIRTPIMILHAEDDHLVPFASAQEVLQFDDLMEDAALEANVSSIDDLLHNMSCCPLIEVSCVELMKLNKSMQGKGRSMTMK
ncbi:Monoacylglycerol lipase ABHD12 [Anabarilius grahami]|uniref:Monoacylglycerol lipase ABHD12 n=1 Tax=Anabarilius grahami TaxID=495550 RepID=A0A3N0XWK5_ANAGA|nr:Monoacylglycerol lipase ABHD12 [Anabarilius grahami]